MTFTWKGKAKEGKYGGLEPVRVRLPRRSLLVFTGDARWKQSLHRRPRTSLPGARPPHRSRSARRRCHYAASRQMHGREPCALCNPPWL